MTPATVSAKLVVVKIIRTMTTTAISADRFHLAECASVTVIAGNSDMSAVQLELSLQVVIEYPQFPGDRVVAGIALPGEVVAMRVVLRVARPATRLHVHIDLGLVAVLTLFFVMNTQ